MKKTVLFAAITLVSIFLIILTIIHTQEIAQNDNNNSYDINQLYSKYSDIEYEIQLKQKEISNFFKASSTVFFAFDQLSDNLLTTVKPLLDQYGYKGIIIITPDRLPGNEGCISKDEFIELVNCGWEVAIGLNNNILISDNESNIEQQLDDYIKSIKEQSIIKENNIDIKTAVYTGNSYYYNENSDEIFRNNGIIAISSQNSQYYTANSYFTEEDSLIKASSLIFNLNNTIESQLNHKISSLLSITIIMRIVEENPIDSNNISIERFEKMLRFIDNYSNSSLNTVSIAELYQTKKDEYFQHYKEVEDIIKQIEDYKNQLIEIDSQISEMLNNSSKGIEYDK